MLVLVSALGLLPLLPLCASGRSLASMKGNELGDGAGSRVGIAVGSNEGTGMGDEVGLVATLSHLSLMPGLLKHAQLPETSKQKRCFKEFSVQKS